MDERPRPTAPRPKELKHKNNVHPNGRGRSESDATGISRSVRGVHSRNESVDMGDSNSMKRSQDADSPDSVSFGPDSFSGGFKAFQHQHSGSSPLSSSPDLMDPDLYADAEIVGPASPTSPFFSPTSDHSPGFPSVQARMPPGTYQRPRSQTFPAMPLDGTYISPPPSSEPLTPKHQSAGVTSPLAEGPNALASPSASNPDTPSGVAPSKDDAKKALELVMSFLRQQPMGYVEQDEYQMVGKLLEKVGLGGNAAAAAAVAAAGQMEAAADTIMGFSNNPP